MATPIPRNEAAFTIAELVYGTNAHPLGSGSTEAASSRIVGVSTDSRAVEPENLFVALVGERFDGHAHAAGALERGARAVLVSREVDGLLELAASRGATVLRVPDTLVALGDLAHWHRLRWARQHTKATKLVGITGSAGKTTTRLAVARSLAALGRRVHASTGNLNNAIGVPMSLFGLGPEHDAAVIEIGMNSPGEIARGTSVAKPDVGVVTLVAAAHTEGVGDVWGVQREKGSLLLGLDADGVAIVNGDCALSRATLLRSPARRAIVYGEREGCDLRLLERKPLGLDGSLLRVSLAWGRETALEFELRTALLGRAGAYATLAALAALVAVDDPRALDAEALRVALESVDAGELGRLAARRTSDGTVVIDDAYNANPASMLSSIHAARELAEAASARLVLVLGAMFELGELSAALHAEVGRSAALAGPAALVVVGELAAPLAEAARAELRAAGSAARVEQLATAADASAVARELVRPGDVVLVKASNSVGLSAVASSLLQSSPHAH